MLKTSFTLLSKKSLTHDVYELTYSCSEMSKELPKPGQYVLFQLAPGLSRAYSIASFSETTFTLIIKRVAEGKGSPMICDAQIGTLFHGMLPLGHFTLRETTRNKCFIGTGTGFAPLYCQLFGTREASLRPSRISFIFGVRGFADSFYEREIVSIGKSWNHMEFIQYFSRELDMSGRSEEHESRVGYVTDWITPDNITHYEEFYICGSPAMVKSAREKLEALGVKKEDIFWEQF